MEPNEFRCEIIINSNEDHPDFITKLLELKPTSAWTKGEQRYRPMTKEPIIGKFREDNIWKYTTNKKYSNEGDCIYLNETINDLLAILTPRRARLKEILQKYPSSYFSCYASYFDSHEYFKLDKTLLKELSYYEIDIVFDSYNFSKDESE